MREFKQIDDYTWNYIENNIEVTIETMIGTWAVGIYNNKTKELLLRFKLEFNYLDDARDCARSIDLTIYEKLCNNY